MGGEGAVLDVGVAPATGRGQRTLALAVGGAVCALGLVSLVLATVNIGSPGPPFVVHRQFYPSDLLIAVVYASFGAFVVVRSGHLIGWALELVGLGFCLTAFGIQYAVLGVEHPDVPAYAWLSQLVVTGWVTGVLACVLLVPCLIGPRTPTGLRRVLALLAAAVAISAGVVRYLTQTADAPPNPLTGGTWVAEAAQAYDDWAVPVYVLLGLVAVADLAARVRRSSGGDRRALRWVLVSVLTTTVAYVSFEIGLSLGRLTLTLGAAGLTAAMLALSAAIFVVVRRPTWNLDLAVSRATVGALLTLFVIAAYVVLVWLGGQLLPVEREDAGLFAVALLALAAMPVRGWLQQRVERLVYGSASDAGQLLERLGAQAGPGDDRSVLEDLTEGLRRSLRLATVVVEAMDAQLSVTAGTPADGLVAVPLHSRGRQVGTLWLGPPPGERLDLRTLQLVRQISGLVASALDLALVNADLERARSRLLDVRQEERRLLRRELHDSLGPSLAGISLALAGMVRTSTLTAADAELLGHLQEELTHRAQDIRLMSRSLLPPALEEGRLGEALDALARRFSSTGMDIDVAADRPDLIDGRRQVTIYHVAAEAVLNAHRHADAGHCSVRLERLDDDALRLTVADDGRGISEADDTGIGLRSMRERAAELGGALTITAATGRGTSVQMVLPAGPPGSGKNDP
ncbi:ATP-binding protein [Nocardioides soli]|uniref:Oxygen sensor histidine kinase NreB n=1 Tax=Nocardioides soli TaxID=1036020 RepID=A0A7W4W0N7_9ACTN|nr:signal transduction histidine kinase [Nocardioides soli]